MLKASSEKLTLDLSSLMFLGQTGLCKVVIVLHKARAEDRMEVEGLGRGERVGNKLCTCVISP